MNDKQGLAAQGATEPQRHPATGAAWARLSAGAREAWAKSSAAAQWLPLPMHMADAGAVALRLHDEWISESVKRRWASHGVGGDGMRTIAWFLAAVHDVGKASPAFLAQHDRLADRARAVGMKVGSMAELREDRMKLPHSLISQYALYTWLVEQGVPPKAATGLTSVVGAHHGRPVAKGALNEATRRPLGTGGAEWADVRGELIDWVADFTGMRELVARELARTATSPGDKNDVPLLLPLPTLVQLAGFVTVADWLASNTDLFPLLPLDSEPLTLEQTQQRAEAAWDEIAMPPAWHPEATDLPADQFFRARFGWDEDRSPHPVQREALGLARHESPGLMFIEAVTGGGKTEAALAVAEAWAARLGAQGMLIALPTQATTNAMFTRVTRWLDRLPQPPLDVPAWALTLAHGKNALNPEFARMVQEMTEFEATWTDTDGLPGIDDSAPIYEEGPENGGAPATETVGAVVHRWFSGSKRRLLSNFAVVTIDQLLMGALKRKHLALEHVALSGKVVVIDEAHASDTYMNVYLDTVLRWLGTYQVPVVVLSATLTAQRREQMTQAYTQQRTGAGTTLPDGEYPRITLVPGGLAAGGNSEPVLVRSVPNSAARREVEWAFGPANLADVVAGVHEAVDEGGCALVIRNTVREAQETFDALQAAGLPVTLNHAAFMAADRAANDADLLGRFGNEEGTARPEQAVVVSTQVAEQSLDIDFDVLFTDLAPMDLLFQRIGRLHRHERSRPDGLARARMQVLVDVAPSEADAANPPLGTRGSRAVYGDYHLLRTASALIEYGPVLAIPDDVPYLVEAALGPEPLPPPTGGALAEARAEHERLTEQQRQKAGTWVLGSPDTRHPDLGTWIDLAGDPSESRMSTAVRDIQPTLEVLLVVTTPDGTTALRPPWLTGGSEEPLDTSVLPSDELAREIASWSIRLPVRVTGHDLDPAIATLEHLPANKGWAWRAHPLLRGELFLPMSQITEGGHELCAPALVDTKGGSDALHYSPERGIEVR